MLTAGSCRPVGPSAGAAGAYSAALGEGGGTSAGFLVSVCEVLSDTGRLSGNMGWLRGATCGVGRSSGADGSVCAGVGAAAGACAAATGVGGGGTVTTGSGWPKTQPTPTTARQ